MALDGPGARGYAEGRRRAGERAGRMRTNPAAWGSPPMQNRHRVRAAAVWLSLAFASLVVVHLLDDLVLDRRRAVMVEIAPGDSTRVKLPGGVLTLRLEAARPDSAAGGGR